MTEGPASTFSAPDSAVHALNMSTTHFTTESAPERWLLYDASNLVLGRMASDIAMKLMGKDQPTYTPSEMNGAFVVVVNAEQVRTTGKKDQVKQYFHYSGYPNGRKEIDFADLQSRRPDEIVRQAVKRMLPKNTLGRDMLRRLKIYAGTDHPHMAQQPVKVETIRS